MEAKDTVMSHEIMMAEIWDLGFGLEGAEGRLPTQKERFDRIAEAQAEISFPAGRLQGIREVVEWINNHLHESPACSYKWCFGDRVWQAQLKEWGIE